ncbi:hypothetical protein ACSZOE_07095 [Aeromonas hydrophila]
MQLVGWLWLHEIVYFIFGKDYELAAELAIMMLPALSFFAVDSVLMQRLYRDKNIFDNVQVVFSINYKHIQLLVVAKSLSFR